MSRLEAYSLQTRTKQNDQLRKESIFKKLFLLLRLRATRFSSGEISKEYLVKYRNDHWDTATVLLSLISCVLNLFLCNILVYLSLDVS